MLPYNSPPPFGAPTPTINPLAAALAAANATSLPGAGSASPGAPLTAPPPSGASPNLAFPQSLSALGIQPGPTPATPLATPPSGLSNGTLTGATPPSGLTNGTLTGQPPAAMGNPLVAPYSGPAANPLVAPYSGPAATPLATPGGGNRPFGFGGFNTGQ